MGSTRKGSPTSKQRKTKNGKKNSERNNIISSAEVRAELWTTVLSRCFACPSFLVKWFREPCSSLVFFFVVVVEQVRIFSAQ